MSQSVCVLGGDIAITKDNETTMEMLAECKTTGNCQTGFFSGYTDRNIEGQFEDVYHGESMQWENWLKKYPRISTHFDCAIYHTDIQKLYDFKCSTKLCPICNVKQRTNFQLQGACKDEGIDSFYVLDGPRSLLGYTKSRMEWSPSERRWNIYNFLYNTTEAFTNETAGFPIGKHAWYFRNKSCRDS